MPNNDLSKLEIGSMFFSVELGECYIADIITNGYEYPLVVKNGDATMVYLMDGRYDKKSVHPSLFMSAASCSEYFFEVADKQAGEFTRAITSQVCEGVDNGNT